MFFVAAGSLLASGLFCFWISLNALLHLDAEAATPPPPPPKEDEEGKRLQK